MCGKVNLYPEIYLNNHHKRTRKLCSACKNYLIIISFTILFNLIICYI